MGEAAPDEPRPDDVTSLDLALAAARSADDKQGRNIVVLDVVQRRVARRG